MVHDILYVSCSSHFNNNQVERTLCDYLLKYLREVLIIINLITQKLQNCIFSFVMFCISL